MESMVIRWKVISVLSTSNLPGVIWRDPWQGPEIRILVPDSGEGRKWAELHPWKQEHPQCVQAGCFLGYRWAEATLLSKPPADKEKIHPWGFRAWAFLAD